MNDDFFGRPHFIKIKDKSMGIYTKDIKDAATEIANEISNMIKAGYVCISGDSYGKENEE